MLNPWLILGLVIFWIVSIAGSAYKGAEYQKGQDAQAQLEAVQKAVADANEQAAKDKNLAIVQAQRNTAAQTRASIVRSQANVAIAASPQPTQCDWDVPSFTSLRDAIAVANGEAAGADSLP